MKKLLIIILSLFLTIPLLKAQTVTGKVFGLDDGNNKVPLPGVNIYWAHNLQGTSSDAQGKFKIEAPNTSQNESVAEDVEDGRGGHKEHMLVFSFVGYQKDTIHVHKDMKNVKVVLNATKEIDGIEVSARKSGSHISRMEPILTQQISSSELTKAACCNL